MSLGRAPQLSTPQRLLVKDGGEGDWWVHRLCTDRQQLERQPSIPDLTALLHEVARDTLQPDARRSPERGHHTPTPWVRIAAPRACEICGRQDRVLIG